MVKSVYPCDNMENFGKMYPPEEYKLVDADAAREVMQALEALQRKLKFL